jgi:hypothetical protein
MIYPSRNPFEYPLSISTLKIDKLENTTFINMQGKTVYQRFSNLNKPGHLDLAYGVYILKLNTKEESSSFKIVKQ